jgi:glycogen operon protein
MLNAFWEPLTFELPAVAPARGSAWRRCIDTALASPDDIQAWSQATPVPQATYRVHARSLVLLALALHD